MADSPLARKLHLKPGHRVLVLQPPDSYPEGLAPLPQGATVTTRAGSGFDAVLLFAASVRELDRLAPRTLRAVKPDGLLWIAYPKKSAKQASDLSRDAGWEVMQ